MPFIRRSRLNALRTDRARFRDQVAEVTADAARDTADMAHAHARTAHTADEYRQQRDAARNTAVALEQDQARLREVAATLADRWTEVATRTDAATERDFAPDGLTASVRGERANVLRKSASDLREVLANGRIPHDLMTSGELGDEPEAVPQAEVTQ